MTEENKNTNTTETKKKKFQLKLNYKVLGIVFGAMLLASAIYYAKGYLIAGVVNGKVITRSKVVSELERRSGQQVLEGLVNQSLIDQEAKKRNIVITQEEIDADIKTIEDNMKAQGSTIEAALAQQNLDRPEFVKILTTNKKIEKMIADKVAVTDAEVDAYLTANKDSFPKDSDQNALKEQVRTYLQQQKIDSESQNLFTQLREQANIRYWARY
jgi:foldase protein PrsA